MLYARVYQLAAWDYYRGVTTPPCPRCGSTVWDPVVENPGVPRTVSFGGSSERVACASCGLLGTLGWSIGAEWFTRSYAQSDVHVRLAEDEIEVERIGAEGSAVRATHLPTGISVEARAYPSAIDNERAALQAVALQVRARDEER